MPAVELSKLGLSQPSLARLDESIFLAILIIFIAVYFIHFIRRVLLGKHPVPTEEV